MTSSKPLNTNQGTEVRMDILRQPHTDTGKKLNLNWLQVAEIISRLEGTRVSHQALKENGQRLKTKLRDRLLADPILREWALEHGYEGESC